MIVANDSAFRYVHIAIDDSLSDPAMTADVHMAEHNAGVHFSIRVHTNIGREYRITNGATRNDTPRGNHRIQCSTGTACLVEDELGRRILPLVSSHWPITIV